MTQTETIKDLHLVNNVQLPHPNESPFFKKTKVKSSVISSYMLKSIYPLYNINQSNSSNMPTRYDMCGTTYPRLTHSRFSSDFDKNGYHLLVFSGSIMVAQDSLNGMLGHLSYISDINIHAINLPGMNRTLVSNHESTKASKGVITDGNHLVEAVILQVEHLLYQGADPEKIILYGYSIGGVISTIAAAHYHYFNKKVYLFNDRSIASVSSRAIGGLLVPYFSKINAITAIAVLIYYNYQGFIALHSAFNPLPNLIVTIGFIICNIIIKAILNHYNWEMNTANAFLSIPKGHKKIAYIPNDDSLTNWSGLFNALPKNELNTKNVKSYNANVKGCNHLRSVTELYDQNKNTVYDNLIRFIKEIKVRACLKNKVINSYIDLLENNPTFKPELQLDLKISQNLIDKFKAYNRQPYLIKYFITTYEYMSLTFYNVFSYIYTVHRNPLSHKHLLSIENLTDKIVDDTVEKIVTEMNPTTLDQYNTNTLNNESNCNVDNLVHIFKNMIDKNLSHPINNANHCKY